MSEDDELRARWREKLLAMSHPAGAADPTLERQHTAYWQEARLEGDELAVYFTGGAPPWSQLAGLEVVVDSPERATVILTLGNGPDAHGPRRLFGVPYRAAVPYPPGLRPDARLVNGPSASNP